MTSSRKGISEYVWILVFVWDVGSSVTPSRLAIQLGVTGCDAASLPWRSSCESHAKWRNFLSEIDLHDKYRLD